jgi:tetratricopeptide (TPR) repeat protein
MSELFNALQKLEEQNEPEVPKPFSPPGGDKKTKNSPPYLKSILLCVLLLVVTVLSLAFIWFGKDYFTSFFTEPKSGVVDRVKKQDPPVVEPIAELPPENSFPMEVAVPEPVPEPVPERVVQEPVASVEEPLPEETEVSSSLPEIKEENTPTETRKQINPVLQIEKVSLEEFIESSTSEAEKEQSRNRQRKRIVYRAEKIREQGDLSNALLLYKKAWSFGPDPGIANNLAAILIHFRRYDESIQYLQQALSLTPDDEDLAYNLRIAREGKKRNK